MAGVETFDVEVAYVGKSASFRMKLEVPSGTTIRGVLERARVAEQWPEIDFQINLVGIFGRLCSLDELVSPGARVEIYRPLSRDPKESRRRRSARRVD